MLCNCMILISQAQQQIFNIQNIAISNSTLQSKKELKLLLGRDSKLSDCAHIASAAVNSLSGVREDADVDGEEHHEQPHNQEVINGGARQLYNPMRNKLYFLLSAHNVATTHTTSIS